MSKIQTKYDHLKYAAVYQSEYAYITAVIINNLTSLAKIGIAIYFSENEVFPLASELIKFLV
jgi:hypothetical protein